MKQEFQHIFLVSVDCLRADTVGCIGGGGLTPNIDKLAEEALVFKRAFANGPATTQSFASIFTSTYFLSHGALKLKKSFKTLAEVLEKEGFWTVAFHSNPFLSAIFGWNRGFREYNQLLEGVETPTLSLIRGDFKAKAFRYLVQKTGLERSRGLLQFLRKTFYRLHGCQIPYAEGKELNSRVFEWVMNNKEKKFFLWMHYMDPHEPFIPPDEYLHGNGIQNRNDALLFNILSGLNPSVRQNEELYRLYKSEVAYVDACIGSLQRFLNDHEMSDDSLIVLLADHGQGFMEHGYFVHPPHSLYNELVHVPLMIYGSEEAQVVSRNVPLLDLAPTILDLLGIDSPTTFLGRSLLSVEQDPLQERPIFIESAKSDLNNLRFDLRHKIVACISRNMKLITNGVTNTVEMYDLQRDFNEEHNIAYIKKETCTELKELITEHSKEVIRLRKGAKSI